jgi:hypothetical protein
MKKTIFLFVLILAISVAGCQSSGAVEQTGSLEVQVTWQTDVWKPGTDAMIVLPDTEVIVHKAFSNEVFRSGVTDLLGGALFTDLPGGWYWVEAVHHPEGVQKSDFGKHWVAHFVHVNTGEIREIDFDFNNAGGWKIW